jgi:hypothetical protein
MNVHADRHSGHEPWHAGPQLLRSYAAGRLDPVAQAAVETHVTRCAECQADARAVVGPPAGPDALWEGIATRIAAPRRSRVGALLRRLGISDADLVIVRAATSLAVPFATALAVAICFALTAGYLTVDRQNLLSLLLAPLVPTVLVAGAYDATDPMREISDTTSLTQVRVALLRTAVAVTAALPVLALMALVPEVGLSPAAWLVPSLCLAVVSLALLTWWDAVPTVATVSGAWALAVSVIGGTGSVDLVATGAVQSVFGVALVLAATVWGARLGLLRQGAPS